MRPSQPHGSASSSRLVSWNSVFGAVGLLALLPSWVGHLGDFHWALDLLSHFRWQYLAVAGLVAAWALWRRQRGVLVAALLTLAMNGWLIGRLASHPEISREAVAPDFHLKVMSLNVLTSNPNKPRVLDAILKTDADVVFLMEVNQEWMQAMEPLKARYPHFYSQPREDNFGIALFSKIPWTDEKVLWLGKASVPSLEVRLKHDGREFRVIGTHPLPPMGPTYAILRNQQLKKLAEHASRQALPVLVMGDLNATPWSHGMHILQEDGKLGYRSLEAPWAPTWRAGSIFGIPIDHILCTSPFIIAERSVGPDVGSDHRPLIATVAWGKDNP